MSLKKYLLLLLLACMSVASYAKKPFSVYAWVTSFNYQTDESVIRERLSFLKSHGITGICTFGRIEPDKTARFYSLLKEYGMEHHAWDNGYSMDQAPDSSMYAVNRLNQTSLEHPAYVSWYQWLDPHNPEVIKRVVEHFSKLADTPEIEYIQLDGIRYADVILARGLWEKYNLVMNEEYPAADYCYCDDCVSDFKQKTGIDIRKVEDPSKCKQWAQFRMDNMTNLVNKIAEVVHAKGKKLSADVFPGPASYAEWMVRQQWNNWNIDAVFPMNYNDFYLKTPSWIGKVTKEEVRSVKRKNTKVYCGIMICQDWRNKQNIKDPEGHGLLPSEMAEAIDGARKAGADGICLFTDSRMTPEHWDALDKIIRGHNNK